MICRTFIFFFLCFFSKNVLIQVQPDTYTSILRKGFNVKQMNDYSVEKVLFIALLIHFACYFVICWQSSSMTDVELIDMLHRILVKPTILITVVNVFWSFWKLTFGESPQMVGLTSILCNGWFPERHLSKRSKDIDHCN